MRQIIRIACTLTASVVCSMALAVEVTPAQAQTAARNWVKKNPRPMTARMKSSEIRLVRTARNETRKALYHAVDLEAGGFVILSGDTRLPPVIAFSDCGSMENLPKNHPLCALLEHDLAQRIDEIMTLDTTVSAQKMALMASASDDSPKSGSFEDSWAELLGAAPRFAKLANDKSGKTAISDVCVSPKDLGMDGLAWGQNVWKDVSTGKYVDTFNFFTPNNWSCGCTATAFAQIMRKYKSPNAPQVSSHLCWINGVPTNMTLNAESYMWDSMPENEGEGVALAQRKAIGRLMLDVGIASQMEWSGNKKGQFAGSSGGAYVVSAARGLRDSFGYASACTFEHTESLAEVFANTGSSYKNAILASLDAQMPVVLDVSNATSAHSIVLDGYGFDGSEDIIYCHINCGWSPNETVNIWYYVGANELLLGKFSYCNIAEIAYNIHPSETGDVISGRVYNSMGKHVKGATVTLVDSSGVRRTTTTNARGIYAFRVTKDGSYTLSAKRNDRESEEQSVSLTMSENSSYALTHGKVPIDEHIGQLGNKWGVKLYLPRAEEDDTPPEPEDDDPGTETGDGTIMSEADWIKISTSKYASTATFSVGANLTLSSGRCYVDAFSGVVKGNGYTIAIDGPLASLGLFNPNGATFERVTFAGIGLKRATGCKFIKCRPKYVPLVDEATGCTFTDCMGTVSIATSTFQMGALSRFAKGCTFKNCKVWGSISGDANTGGLVGDAEGCTFTDCISLAKVSGVSEVGGLVGWAEANCQFLNCAARGEVSGRGFVGGLVGYCEGSSLKNCQATGNVTGGKVTGGFAGQLRNCEAQKCSAKGKVTCDVGQTDAPGGIGGFAGEIVGIDDGSVSLSYCAATGAVLGDGGSSVGGFVGDCHGETATTKIQCSYASGTVVGGSFVGGFAGELSNCSIFNCYSTGSATANGFANSSGSGNGMDMGMSAYAGGFAGQADSKGGTDCRYCYAVGYVKTVQGSSMLDMSYSGGLTPLPLSDEQADMMSSMLSMFMSDCVSCYWSIPGTGRKYSGMGTGKSAVDMKKQSTFTGWDFSSIWAIDEGTSYPYFKELGRTGVIDDIGDDSDDTGGDDPSGGDVGFTVTVTFDANGGTVSPTAKTLEKDDEIGELPTPSRKGSTFAGWWTEVNGGWQVTDDTIIFKDMTLYAHWRSSSVFPDLLPYTPSGWSAPIVVVRSSSDTVDATGITSTDTLFVRRAYICRNAPVSTRFYIKIYVDGVEKYSRYSESMAEDQWKTGDAYELGMLAPGTHTIKMIVDSSDAVPESDEGNNTYVKTITVGGGSVCTVTFNANGGTVSPTTKTVESGKAVGDLPTPTYGSDVFDGWFTRASGGTRVTESTKVTANVTYYAHWTSIGGKPNLVVNSVTACRKTVYIGETFHLRYTVGNAGKASGGSSVTSISDGNNKYSFRQACGSIPVGSERTYRLNINSSTLGVGSHTITVAADISGQIAESSESDNSKVIYLSVINLPETGNNVDWQFHARSGSPDVAYLSKSAYSTKAETTFKQGETIYVQINFWNAQQKNTTGEVKAAALLDTGDGWQWSWTSLSGGSTAYISDSSRVVSVLQNLLPGTYTLEFLLDNARFYGGDYVWPESSKLNNTKTIEFTVGGNSCTVTFDATVGAVSQAMRTVVAGSPVGTLPTPTSRSHTFAGWFTAASGGTRVTASTVVTGDVTYYAHWYDDRAGTIVVRSAAPATAGKAARIVLGRVGGSVGRIAVKVKTQTSTGICGTDFAYVKDVLVWEDGDTSDKVIEIPTYASGVGKSLRVKLATLTTGTYEGCVTARLAETKVYAEMQPPNPGRVVVTGPEPLSVTAGEPLYMTFGRVGGSDGSIAVKAKTQTSTALMGVNGSADFDYVKATLEWGDGDTSERYIEIPTYAGPWEGVRMLRVKLATLATGAYAGNLVPALDQAKVYADIESPTAFGTVYVAPDTVNPKAGQTLRLVFRRVGGRDYPIAVKYKVQTSTAVAGQDFEYMKGVVTWGDGEDYDQEIEVPTYPSAAGKQLRVKLSTLTQGDYTGCVTPHLNSAKVYVPLQ